MILRVDLFNNEGSFFIDTASLLFVQIGECMQAELLSSSMISLWSLFSWVTLSLETIINILLHCSHKPLKYFLILFFVILQCNIFKMLFVLKLFVTILVFPFIYPQWIFALFVKSCHLTKCYPAALSLCQFHPRSIVVTCPVMLFQQKKGI